MILKKGNIIALILAVGLMIGCNDRSKQSEKQNLPTAGEAANNPTTVKIIDSTYNFGKVTDGEKVVFSYRFINSGDHPLVISAANASCGCTVPERPEQPIAPGETGYIKVVFDSKGRVGPVVKEVHVSSNAKPDFPTLILKGEVAPQQ